MEFSLTSRKHFVSGKAKLKILLLKLQKEYSSGLRGYDKADRDPSYSKAWKHCLPPEDIWKGLFLEEKVL